jgi:subtilase family serine protease
LYYRFSEDKSNWSNWTVYGDTLESPPFEWEYTAIKGDGYYEFKINVTDIAGNQVESKVFPVVITSFPTTLTLVMISLVIILSLISVAIFIKWRKQK